MIRFIPLFQVFNFCRSKCRKNFDLKRNPRKVRWTKAFRKANGKDLRVVFIIQNLFYQQDSTYEFEKIRHTPVKYNRELMGKTIRAMKRIQQIRQAREQRYLKERMKAAKKQKKQQIELEVKQHIDLIAPPSSKNYKTVHEKIKQKFEKKDTVMEEDE